MDEAAPLLANDQCQSRIARTSTPHNKSNVVSFDSSGDPDNPIEWPTRYKWTIVALLAFTSFTVTFTCISVVPVARQIVHDLDPESSSKSASVLLVTIWELGEAAGPLLIAPASEVFGRYPVMNVANVLFISATVLAALCESTPLFIAARALTGLGVASNVLNPAIVGDMFVSEERGTAMSLIMLAPLIGGAFGPAIAGAVAQSVGWRQIMWLSAALAGVAEILFLTIFRETYKLSILRRRAAELTTASDPDWVIEGEQKSQTPWDAIMRPFLVLFSSGVLQALSLFGGLIFAFYYVVATSLPDILDTMYGLSPALTGASLICFSAGSTISVIVCNFTLDSIYIRLSKSHDGVGQAEYRLPLAISASISLPIVVAAYGWITELHLPLPVLLTLVGFMGFITFFGFLPLIAYVVDAFGLYSASAMTAVIVTRCLMGTFLPLTTAPLVEKLGYGWGFTVLAGICLVAAPVPALILRYGRQWREGSKYTKDE